MAGYSTFRRRSHPLLASHNSWTWRFLPGVLVGIAVKWWLDNGPGSKGADGQKSGRREKPKRILASNSASNLVQEEYKMVLCVNDSLKMGKGKIAAQCAHAAVGVVEAHKAHAAAVFEAWELKGHAKVALRVPTEAELLSLARAADEKGLFNFQVVDAGRTQIPVGSRTVLAVGPGPKSLIDQITGHLKLL